VKLAFLCSEYPAISHTFVLREIESLRAAGLEIDTFTIRRTPPEKLLSDLDRRAAETTFAILPPRLGQVLGAHLNVARRSPGAYARALRRALGLAPAGLRGRLWQAFYFAEAVVLLRRLERRGIRHVHVHLANVAADVAMIAAGLGTDLDPDRPLTWSFTMHGPTEFADLRHFRLGEKVADAAFVVCISDFARSQLMAISGPEDWGALRVVHCGIPVANFTRSAPPPPAGGPTRVLYLGRLVPEKGQSVLLEAVAALAAEGRDVELTLAGAGDLRPDLERMAARIGIADRVEFPGAVGQEALRDLYGRASIFCLPSFGEGVPVVLMEAMAMEVPTISTRIAGIPELIEDGVGGLLVPPGRADRLAAAIASVIDDPERGRRLAAEGRAKVLAEFDAETSAAQLRAVFEEMLGDPTRAPGAGERGAQPVISNVGA
jgi:colanic acid/amylovoran biosynthesis glycosyltransferase